MHRRNSACRFLVVALACAAAVGCDRIPRHDATKNGEWEQTVSAPAELARRISALHLNRDYPAIAECIVPDRRAATIALISAVDDVLAANQNLKEVAETRYSGPAAETWNLAAMENNLGVFSKDMNVISQTFKGDKAYVTLQDGSNVPLVHAEFELNDGRWLFRPETAPAALQRELKTLALILWELSDLVRAGARVDAFADAFRARVVPQIAKAANVTDGPSTLADAGDAPP